MSRRRPSGGKPRADLLSMRQKDANERNAKWADLSLADQLKTLNQRFPKGAVKQKERIKAKIRALSNN